MLPRHPDLAYMICGDEHRPRPARGEGAHARRRRTRDLHRLCRRGREGRPLPVGRLLPARRLG
ncbi:MAG: hypothetical protein WDO24_19565 [Pseudomonadota bacterium]